MRARPILAALMLLAAVLPLDCSESSAVETTDRRNEILRVRRGDFEKRHLLTGELAAERGDSVTVPRIPTWQTAVKWMEADGSTVAPGQKVVELDNTPFVSNLEEKRLGASQAEQNLAKERAKFAADLAEKQFEVERKRLDLETARLQASVSEAVLAKREHQDRQLALHRATLEYQKAEANLSSLRKAVQADLQNLQLQLEKTRGEIAVAERAIQELILRAPRGGIIVVGDHPWEGRKLQVGDTVWVGMPIMNLPDLSTLEVVAILADVDDRRIAVGMPVRVTMDAYPQEIFRGSVTSIAPVAQEAGGQSLRRGFKAVIDLEHIDSQRMRPGFSVKASVQTSLLKNVLLAPRSCLDLSGRGEARARLADGSEAAVRITDCNPHECIIEEGLKEGVPLSLVAVTEQEDS